MDPLPRLPKTRLTWHTSSLRIIRGIGSPSPRALLNLIQYNMGPLTLSFTGGKGALNRGGCLFKTVPISIHRETSSYYDRSNPDWAGQVFYFRGVPRALSSIRFRKGVSCLDNSFFVLSPRSSCSLTGSLARWSPMIGEFELLEDNVNSSDN